MHMHYNWGWGVRVGGGWGLQGKARGKNDKKIFNSRRCLLKMSNRVNIGSYNNTVGPVQKTQ